MKILVATTNPGKLREIERALSDLTVEILSLQDFPDMPSVLEDGDTFEANAAKKALAAAHHTGIISIADDSGLTVAALNGQPGVTSARYAGEGATDEDNNRKLLNELCGVPAEDRGCAFICVIAVAVPGEPVELIYGSCDGMILESPRGELGFGYDPLFFHPESKATFAELDMEKKLEVSHRGVALRTLRGRIPAILARMRRP